MDRKSYKKFATKFEKPSPIIKNCIWAFFVGGGICTLGQLIMNSLGKMGLSDNSAQKWVPIILIVLACLFTGIGWFDRIAKKTGAGTLLPITGFANAMCSPAIDNKAEGWILGVGAKMFTIAGPVIVYGTVSSALYGLILYLLQKI